MREHSKTPWTQGEGNDSNMIYATDVKAIAQCYRNIHISTANAAFIVTACNAHEQLVEALKSFMVRMERCGEYDDGCFYYARTAASELEEPMRLAKAALAKVKP